MNFRILSILLLAFVSCFFQTKGAVGPPKVKCISVASNDDITITWEQPADPLGEFVSYQVFQSTNATGSYALAGSIATYAQTNFTFSGANLNSGTSFFYLTTMYNDGIADSFSTSSDTVQPILLHVDTVLQSKIGIEWNKIHNPKISSHSNQYNVFRRYSGQAWQLIGSTNYNVEEYEDNVAFCSDSIEYKIEVVDTSIMCISTSRILKGLYEDDFPPLNPIIDSVSVTQNGEVEIGWQKGTPSDIGGYIVALELGSGFNLDTVWHSDSTFFSDIQANPNSKSETYGVLAFDTCWKGNPYSPNTSASAVQHKTIFLSSELNACERSVLLNWTHYEGWNSGISGYKIYASKNGQQQVLLQEISGGETTFLHEGLEENANYCYFVRAIEAGGTGRTSSSNFLCQTITVPNLPNQQYLNYITVLDDNTIEVSCYIDKNAAVQHYDFERATSINGSFEIVTQVENSDDTIISIVDASVDASERPYYYRVVAIDVCGNKVEISNVSNSINASVANVENENFLNIIKWNPYADWNSFGGGVGFYNIYKSNNATVFDDTPFAIVSSDDLEFEDDISDESDNGSTFCYLIEAVESSGNIYQFQDRSKSNVACVKIAPKIYIANAFSPNNNGLNDVFKPQISYANLDEYSLAIYNRFGGVVFNTEDINEGWDGGDAPDGVYVYLMKYTDQNGEIQRLRSTITLLR